jgi:hypothetical protein
MAKVLGIGTNLATFSIFYNLKSPQVLKVSANASLLVISIVNNRKMGELERRQDDPPVTLGFFLEYLMISGNSRYDILTDETKKGRAKSDSAFLMW